MQLNFCLRKSAAISLIALLLFNWYGYRFVTNYLQNKAVSQLEARLDSKNYDESQLIEIKVELNIPYQYSWSNFERHSGEIELNGRIYAYVERKVEDGYLILKCIPNTQKQNIKNADNILFTANNGLDQEHNGKNNSPLNSLFKNMLSDYDNHQQSYNLSLLTNGAKSVLSSNCSILSNIDLPVAEQPPEIA